jgi:outer membrane protein assembly factor BamB
VVVDNDINKNGDVEFNIRLFFGTSDITHSDEASSTEGNPYHFFAYVDHSDKGECNANSVDLDWFRALPPGHRAFTSAFAAAGTVYFGTYASEKEALSEEITTGKLYALNIADGAVIFEQELGNVISAPLVEDEHLYFKAQESGGKNPVVLGGGGYNNDVVKSPAAIAGIQAWKEIW